MNTDHEKGFTLLELLIAISILSIGLLGLATMLSTGIGTDRFAHAVAIESSMGTSVMEEIVSRDGSDPVFSSGISGAVYDLDPGSAATTRTVQGRSYSASYSISPNNPVSGVTRVDVVVTGAGRSISSTTFKSNV